MGTERTLEFLLEQQAKHDAQISELRTHLVGIAQSQERTNALVEVLAERQVRTEGELSDLTQNVANLTDRQSKTEEMLQALIQLFERHIANH